MEELKDIPRFEEMIGDPVFSFTSESPVVMQMNVGKRCNLTCKHCHVNAGPKRTEVMTRTVMESCLKVFRQQGFTSIDITGGAPEMNPDFEWLVEAACECCEDVTVRTNLVILEEELYRHLLESYRHHQVKLVCSLPHYRPGEMDRVRGDGTFQAAIRILQRLNALGYGSDPALSLNMVYNPAGAFFPPDQEALEKEYKERLSEDYGICFNHLFTITNNPMGRFGSFLEQSGNLAPYLWKLYQAFNPATLPGMMCRFQLSVGYDGTLYDCDFNQAGDLPLRSGKTIFNMVGTQYEQREIRFGKHCFACTAGQGSSCGGSTE